MYNIEDIAKINEENAKIFYDRSNSDITVCLNFIPHFQDMDSKGKEHLGVCGFTWFDDIYEIKKVCYISEMVQDLMNKRYCISNFSYFEDVLKKRFKNMKYVNNYKPDSIWHTTLSDEAQLEFLKEANIIGDSNYSDSSYISHLESELNKRRLYNDKIERNITVKTGTKNNKVVMNTKALTNNDNIFNRLRSVNNYVETNLNAVAKVSRLSEIKHKYYISPDNLVEYNTKNMESKKSPTFEIYKGWVLKRKDKCDKYLGLVAILDSKFNKIVKYCYFVELARDIVAGLYSISNLNVTINYDMLHWEDLEDYIPSYTGSKVTKEYTQQYLNMFGFNGLNRYKNENELLNIYNLLEGKKENRLSYTYDKFCLHNRNKSSIKGSLFLDNFVLQFEDDVVVGLYSEIDKSHYIKVCYLTELIRDIEDENYTIVNKEILKDKLECLDWTTVNNYTPNYSNSTHLPDQLLYLYCRKVLDYAKICKSKKIEERVANLNLNQYLLNNITEQIGLLEFKEMQEKAEKVDAIFDSSLDTDFYGITDNTNIPKEVDDSNDVTIGKFVTLTINDLVSITGFSYNKIYAQVNSLNIKLKKENNKLVLNKKALDAYSEKYDKDLAYKILKHSIFEDEYISISDLSKYESIQYATLRERLNKLNINIEKMDIDLCIDRFELERYLLKYNKDLYNELVSGNSIVPVNKKVDIIENPNNIKVTNNNVENKKVATKNTNKDTAEITQDKTNTNVSDITAVYDELRRILDCDTSNTIVEEVSDNKTEVEFDNKLIETKSVEVNNSNVEVFNNNMEITLSVNGNQIALTLNENMKEFSGSIGGIEFTFRRK